jgi:hypothetical protein
VGEDAVRKERVLFGEGSLAYAAGVLRNTPRVITTQRKPKGAKRLSKGAKRDPKGAKREPKGAKREPKGAKREPKIKKIIKNHALERSKFSFFCLLSFFFKIVKTVMAHL